MKKFIFRLADELGTANIVIDQPQNGIDLKMAMDKNFHLKFYFLLVVLGTSCIGLAWWIADAIVNL